MTQLMERSSAPGKAIRHISVECPEDIRTQLVFRQERQVLFDVTLSGDLEFVYIQSFRELLRKGKAYRKHAGRIESIKSSARLLSPDRSLYCVFDGKELLHYGWLTESVCRHYAIRKGEVVIGPIWTAGSARGRGVATFATMAAINRCFANGKRVFYIDTSADNHPCLRVIDKCEFGVPIAAHIRER